MSANRGEDPFPGAVGVFVAVDPDHPGLRRHQPVGLAGVALGHEALPPPTDDQGQGRKTGTPGGGRSEKGAAG